jgi:uncharacterized SAM-binding protein YcdF (DUF218 family)
MYKRLLKSGIPNDRIITEKESHNTYENIKNSIDYYEGLSTSNYSPKYTVVTAGFHRMRVKQLLESVDYNAGVFCADGPNTHRGDWYKKSIGINIIFDELTKLLGI